MPKQSGKINSAEREICVRLKLFRESIGWHQQDFSDRLGISLNQCVGVEYARTPLKYSVAWKIRELFGLSLAWIANGKYPPNQPDLDPWPIPASVKNQSALLSEIADALRFQELGSPAHKEREKTWFAWLAENKKRVLFKPGRSVTLAILKDNLVEWMARIPEKNVQDFATEIIQCGQSYADKFSTDPATKIDVRTRTLIWGEMREEINKRLSPKTASDLHLTNTETSGLLISDVKAQLPSLRERLNRATKETGTMSALADFLGKVTGQNVPLASVSRWLSGKREPGGEITLLMLRWVEQQERQK